MADPRVLAALPLAAAKLRREAQGKRQLQAMPDGELNRLVLASRAARLLEADGRPADKARLYGLADRLLTDHATLCPARPWTPPTVRDVLRLAGHPDLADRLDAPPVERSTP